MHPGQSSIPLSDLQLCRSQLTAVHINKNDFTHKVGDVSKHFTLYRFKCIRSCLFVFVFHSIKHLNYCAIKRSQRDIWSKDIGNRGGG